jgi:hypothetical protein
MHRSDSTEPATLTSPLGEWELTLVGGGRIRLSAHAYHEDQGDYVFAMLMVGTPHYEIDVARIPAAIVEEIEGG